MSLTITDLFAGAGGSSTGMIAVPGVKVQMAANHLPLAVDVHNANHPDSDHACVDLHQEDPRFFPRTDMLWASPECTKWSQANGTKLPDIEEGLFEDPNSNEAADRSRLLMFDVLRFIEHHRYRAVIVENVVDIAMQVKYRRAWAAWRTQLRGLGYDFRVVSLNSMHAQYLGDPAPQSRDRLYVVAWPIGEAAPDIEQVMRPAAWCARCEEMVESRQAFKPGRTVGRYRAQYIYVHGDCGTAVEPGWLPAAAAIDWTLPGQRIGDRKKPLSAKTMARIEAGLRMYGTEPYITVRRGEMNNSRISGMNEPMAAVVASGNHHGLVVPLEGRAGVDTAKYTTEPMRTQTARHDSALVVPYYGNSECAQTTRKPIGTLTTHDRYALLVPSGGTWREGAQHSDEPFATRTTRESDGVAFIAELHGGGSNHRPVTEPLCTVMASGNHHMLVRHNSSKGPGGEMCTPASEPARTLTTTGHQSLVSIAQQVEDATFRMLEPSEIAAAMAFPGDYQWEVRNAKGKLPTRRDTVKLMGNAVTPPAARDLMYAVAESLGGTA